MSAWQKVESFEVGIVLTRARLIEAGALDAPPYTVALNMGSPKLLMIGCATLGRAAAILVQTSGAMLARYAHLACGRDEPEAVLRAALRELLTADHALH